MIGYKNYEEFLSKIPPSYRAENIVFLYYASYLKYVSPKILYSLLERFKDYTINGERNFLRDVVVSDLLQHSNCMEQAFLIYELDSELVYHIQNNIEQELAKYNVSLNYNKEIIVDFVETIQYNPHSSK